MGVETQLPGRRGLVLVPSESRAVRFGQFRQHGRQQHPVQLHRRIAAQLQRKHGRNLGPIQRRPMRDGHLRTGNSCPAVGWQFDGQHGRQRRRLHLLLNFINRIIQIDDSWSLMCVGYFNIIWWCTNTNVNDEFRSNGINWRNAKSFNKKKSGTCRMKVICFFVEIR